MTPIGARANTKFHVSSLANAMSARAASGHVAPCDVVSAGLANDEGAYSRLFVLRPPPGLPPVRGEEKKVEPPP